MLKQQSLVISIVFRVLDVLLIWLSGALAYWLRFGIERFPIPLTYGALILIGGLIAASLFPMLGVYHSWRARGFWAPSGRVLASWIIVYLLLMVLLVVSKQGEAFSRLWVGYWLVSAASMLIVLRLAVYSWLRSLRARGYNLRRAVVVGSGPHAQGLIRQSRAAPWAGFEVAAVFNWQLPPGQFEGFTVRSLDSLAHFVEREPIDEVWVAIPFGRGDKLRVVLDYLRCSTVTVRYAPDLFGLFLLNHGVTDILDTPMIDLTASPMVGVNRLIKGLEDRLLAALILVLISPLMFVIALGVKLSSPGPIFFRQERLGWNGRPFQMLKFRSMPVNTEKDGVQWGNAQNKPATPFGAFLRRTSLDELPQFINVLKGDMSIVGPRPERPVFVEKFKDEIPGYMQKHMVKAGITGWAQVNGWRGDTDLNKRIEHDLYYIDHWSLAFDLKIIFLSLFKGFAHKNAY